MALLKFPVLRSPFLLAPTFSRDYSDRQLHRPTEVPENMQSTSVSRNDDVLLRASTFLKQPLVAAFVAGGCAGAVSRTIVSPLERMKIIFQTQKPADGSYHGFGNTLYRIHQEEGWRGYFRGNGVNVLRIVPYSAVQFTTYSIMKRYLGIDKKQARSVVDRMLAGAISGIVCVTATYPLDLIRTRLAVQTAAIGSERADTKKPPGIWATARSVYQNEGGLRALWRGLVPTCLGVAPFLAINFSLYDQIRHSLSKDERKLSSFSTLCAGALSGVVAQTVTFPLDVLRRRFQVASFDRGTLGFEYNSVLGAARAIVRTEGLRGLYKGLVPNLAKAIPAMASSFWTFEAVKRLLGSS